MQTTTHFHVRKQFPVTCQDVLHVLILIAICFWFCMAPIPSFGQPTLGPIGNNDFSAFGSTPLDFPTLQQATSMLEPAQVPAVQTMPEVSGTAIPFAGTFAQSIPPVPAEAPVSPATANQYSPIQSPPYQPLQPHSPQREIVVNLDHPFRQYWGVPNDPQTKITGKSTTVAELLAGTRSSTVRTRLLQTYWELSGLLAIYHFRHESEKLASSAIGQQPDMMTLLREQRRTAEVEFIKQQWVLAELLKQYKGYSLRESELPIPADYPLCPRYQTHADQIARTERTQYLGRMIPIQEQLIESKNGTWKAASEMIPNASQPFFVVSNQRTMAFLDLTKAIVDYNKMIAEYALETIPSNISQQQLVGAIVRSPKVDAAPAQPQTQTATEGIRLTRYEVPADVLSQPVQRVTYEFQTEHPSASIPPSLPLPERIETEVTEVMSETSALLMDF